jgi:hypothetical protein
VISVQQVRQEMSNILAANPEAKNPYLCLYTTKEGQHCIAGQLIKNLGGNLPPVLETATSPNGRKFDVLLGTFDTGLEFEPVAKRYISLLQLKADHGASWAQAKSEVDEEYAKHGAYL